MEGECNVIHLRGNFQGPTFKCCSKKEVVKTLQCCLVKEEMASQDISEGALGSLVDGREDTQPQRSSAGKERVKYYENQRM